MRHILCEKKIVCLNIFYSDIHKLIYLLKSYEREWSVMLGLGSASYLDGRKIPSYIFYNYNKINP